ncbi:MAG: nucleotidyltransferase family protein [Candidatus Omnitrophota bacterium]
MKNITIHPRVTIKEAMEVLNETAEKVLLVVDEKESLIGSLTDGDIRRYILKGCDLNDVIEKVYNSNPVFVYARDLEQEKIKQIFLQNKVDLIPVVASNRKVIDFITWKKVFGTGRSPENQKLDVPVVIMAGGGGTRLEPFTKVLPKSLIPIGEKPVIDHIIERFRAYGINEFYLTVHHMSKIIRAYFEEKEPDYSIEFAQEKEPRGTAGSLKLLSHKLNKPFFVSNCDVIIKTNYADFYRAHVKNNYDITLVASAKEFNIPYGICELNGGGSLKRIQEKPKYNFLVNTGLYILNPAVIELIPDDEVFHITHLMDKVRENNGTIGVYPVSENSWIDVGQWTEYRMALKAIEGIDTI